MTLSDQVTLTLRNRHQMIRAYFLSFQSFLLKNMIEKMCLRNPKQIFSIVLHFLVTNTVSHLDFGQKPQEFFKM